MTRLLVYEPSFRKIADEVARRAPDLEVLLIDGSGAISLNGAPVSLDEAHPDAVWANHEVFMSGASRAFFTAALKSPNLAWVQSAAAGFDNKVFADLAKKGVALTTSHGQAVGMADYVLAGVLDHFQGGPARRAAQAAHEWRRDGAREITGTRWLIVGFGAIGQGVARRAQAFGAEIVGVRRDLSPHPHADRMVDLDSLPGELPQTDVVVLAIPLGARTQHLANSAFFAAMKARSVLVNVGRGGLVDEAALLRALDAGTPEHAVLDVFETEPLPADSPFWDHPRVSLTGHCSGITGGQNDRNQDLFLENLGRFARGETLLNLARREDVLAAQR